MSECLKELLTAVFSTKVFLVQGFKQFYEQMKIFLETRKPKYQLSCGKLTFSSISALKALHHIIA